MEISKTRLDEAVRYAVSQFFICAPQDGESVLAEDVEREVISGLSREFGFTKGAARDIFRPCFWVLTDQLGRKAYSFEHHQERGSTDLGPLFIAPAGVGEDSYAQEIIDEKSGYLVAKLEGEGCVVRNGED